MSLIWQNFFFLDLKKFFFLGLVNYTFFIICLCFTLFWAILYSCFVYCLGKLFFKFVLGMFQKKKFFFFRSKKKKFGCSKKSFLVKKGLKNGEKVRTKSPSETSNWNWFVILFVFFLSNLICNCFYLMWVFPLS